MNKILNRAFLNAVGTFTYIILIVLLIFSLQNSNAEDSLIILMSMLMLFVCSAAITGFLVFGKPVMLYIDGKKREAVLLLAHTIGILVLLTIISFIFLVVYFV